SMFGTILILSSPGSAVAIDPVPSSPRAATWPIRPGRRPSHSGPEIPLDPASPPTHSPLLSYPRSMSSYRARLLPPRLAAISLDVSRAALDLRQGIPISLAHAVANGTDPP